MPFDSDFSGCIGHKLMVVPVYGYGWSFVDREGSPCRLESIPVPFIAKIEEFLSLDGYPVAACCKVSDSWSILHDWYVTLIPLFDDGRINLQSESGHFGTLICPEKPTVDTKCAVKNHPDILITESLPRYRGISEAAKNPDLLKDALRSSFSPRLSNDE